MTEDVRRILEALASIRISAQPEEFEIHAAIEQALERAGIEFVHECRLSPGRRIDFLCGQIGIEVKKSRPVAARLKQQIERYMESEMVSAMIVVLQKPCSLPDKIGGKDVHVLALNRLWGVALH